jgi:hypothetical protein
VIFNSRYSRLFCFQLVSQLWKLRAYVKVRNAFLMFRKGNHFLDFYTATAQRLLRLNQGSMPPQFIGPKLLTALHNVAICPVMETAGMGRNNRHK